MMNLAAPQHAPMNAVHPVVTVRGQLASWKPSDSMVALELSIELSGDPVGRAALTYFNPTLANATNPALGLVGFTSEDGVRPHNAGSFKWSGSVPKNQALNLLVWSRLGHVQVVPLFACVGVQDSFLLAGRQVTLTFPA